MNQPFTKIGFALFFPVALLSGAGPVTTKFVGSQACSRCHLQISVNYASSPMGLSMVPASETRERVLPAGSQTVTNGNISFKVSRRGDDLYQEESQTDASGTLVFKKVYKLEYALGSGSNGISYAVRKGNYIFEAPLSYYQRDRAWHLSPGYEKTNAGFSRPLSSGCVTCHSGRVNAVPDRDGLYRDPAFSELAIGCENCHGPGSLHVQKPASSNIVNPAKLSGSRADEICMNCHQAGDARAFQQGKTSEDVRPGIPLIDVLAIFKIPSSLSKDRANDLLEHHSSMQTSKCFQGSNGRLRCNTCHDPHARPTKTETTAYFDQKCLGCHTVSSCKRAVAPGLHSGSGCADCHMPKREIGTISHSALTDHRIAARPREPLPPVTNQPPAAKVADLDLVNRSNSEPLSPLVLWQAYGELSERQAHYQSRYFELLDVVAKQYPGNSLVQAALGRKIFRQGGPGANERAIIHLQTAIKSGFTAPTAFEDLADAFAAVGKADDSIDTLKQGLALSPYASRLHKSLILQYVTSKRYSLAKEEIRSYLELFPEDSFIRDLLLKAGG